MPFVFKGRGGALQTWAYGTDMSVSQGRTDYGNGRLGCEAAYVLYVLLRSQVMLPVRRVTLNDSSRNAAVMWCTGPRPRAAHIPRVTKPLLPRRCGGGGVLPGVNYMQGRDP